MATPLRMLVPAPTQRVRPGPQPGGRLGYLPALDGLRGVAVLLVSLLHFHVPFLPGGYLGVDIFFVLSGFLITSLLVQEWGATGGVDLWRFYGRRVLRLMPALWVMLLVLVPLLTAEQLVAGLGYTANWVMAEGVQLAYLNHVWSLAIEEQFYLAWPLVLVGLLRTGVSARVLVAVACGLALAVALNRVAQVGGGAHWQRLYYGTDTRVDGLLLGAAGGLVWGWYPLGQRALRVIHQGAWGGVATIALLIFTLPVEEMTLYWCGLTVASLGAVMVVLRVVTLPVVGPWRVLQWRPLVALGRISYGVYLWHHPVAYAAAVLGIPWWLGTAVGLPLSVALAAVSYQVVERPALAVKERLRSPSREPQPRIPKAA